MTETRRGPGVPAPPPAAVPGAGWIERIKRPLRGKPGYSIAQIFYHQLRIRYGRSARKLTTRADKPGLLMIETSAKCNLQCPKCYYRESSRPRGLIGKDLALDLLAQGQTAGLKTVCLSQAGEPLIHPELETFIAAAREKNLIPYFVTNATLLSPERSRGLIQAGLTHLVVSFDGWDEDSCAQRQTGARMDKVIENLRKFRELRGKGTSPSMASVTILDRKSLPHFSEIKKIIAPLVDTVTFLPLLDFGVPGREIGRELMLGTGSWKRSPCLHLWNDFTVGWDGRVTACCNDHEYLLAYGDVREKPIAEIWNSPAVQDWRRLHLEGKYGAMPLCGGCTIDFIRSVKYAFIKRRLEMAVRD